MFKVEREFVFKFLKIDIHRLRMTYISQNDLRQNNFITVPRVMVA